MKADKQRMIDEFTKLVSIDSPSYGERQMGDYVKSRLTALGLSVTEDTAGETLNSQCGNIYGKLDGNIDAEPLLFCVHMDTVEPSRGKQAVIGPDGVIKSRGDTVLGADDLSGVAAVLEALTVLKTQNLKHGMIEVLFTVAEEVYCQGSRLFDFSTVRSKSAYVLDMAGPVGTAAYWAPRILSFTVTIHGKASHAGFAPEHGIHAIAIGSKAIANLTMGHVDEDTTLNIGMIEGGRATNIVPEKCTIKGEVRSLNHEKALKQIALVQGEFDTTAGALGATVDFDLYTASVAYQTPLDHLVVSRFKTACTQLGLAGSMVKTFGGSDQNIMAQHGITGIVVANAMNTPQ